MLSTILGSSVIVGLVANWVILRTAARKISIENITQQRQLWRETIREKASEVAKAYKGNDSSSRIEELYVEFQLLLNPRDPDDIEILDTIWEMKKKEKNPKLLIELSEKLSLLLKYDWDRAKYEAKPLSFLCGKPKPRTKYEAKKDEAKDENKKDENKLVSFLCDKPKPRISYKNYNYKRNEDNRSC